MALQGTQRQLGKNAFLFVGTKLVACATDLEITIATSKESTLCQGSEGIDTGEPGTKTYTWSISGMYREYASGEVATNVGYDQLFDSIEDGAEVTILFDNETVGGVTYTGVGYFNDLKLTSAVNKNATYSGSGWFNSLVKATKTA